MNRYYYVRQALPGLPAGRVERFADHRALAFLRAGDIEEYQPTKHAGLPGAPDARLPTETKRK